MNRRSATALGASLLVLTLPNAAQAGTLAGVTDNLGSAKVEARVVATGPVDAKTVVKGKIGINRHSPVRAETKVKAKARGTETHQRVETRGGARLDSAVRTHAGPVEVQTRAKARLHHDRGGEAVRSSAGAAHGLAKHGHRAATKNTGKAKHLPGAHGARQVARSKGGQLDHLSLPSRGSGEPLKGVGREVANPLEAGLTGALLLGLAGLAASVARAGFRRSLR
jgi:hypothetical protein